MTDPFEGIVLLGCPRSGTTLMRRILDHHPSIACPGETGVLRGSARMLETETTGVGVEVGVLPGLRHAGFDESEVFGRVREFAFSFLRECAMRVGKKRWMEKTPFDSFHIPMIERICGDRVHYICLVRHALDVAPSIEELCQKSESFLLEFHEYVGREKRPLEAFTRLWCDVNTSILSLIERRANQTTLIRYEDLVRDPIATVQHVLSRLGEEMPVNLVEHALETAGRIGLGDWKTYSRSTVDAGSVGRWKRLHPFSLAKMAEIANPMLERLGYDRVTVEWDSNPEMAQRRYELGLLLNAAKQERAGGND